MRNLIHALFVSLLSALVGSAAVAQGPGPGPGADFGGFGPPGSENQTRERIRTMRAVSLANHLDLDERQALRMNATMRRFDEEREKVKAGLKQSFEVLEKASKAEKIDPAGAKAIDAAIGAVMKSHEQIASLRREEFLALAKDLDPKKRARLAIFLRDFPKHVRKAMRQGRGRRGPRGGGGGPGFAPHLLEEDF